MNKSSTQVQSEKDLCELPFLWPKVKQQYYGMKW